MNAARSTFEILRRHNIWRVTLDGRFFGDYRSSRQADEAVHAAAVALRAHGRTVHVVTTLANGAP